MSAKIVRQVTADEVRAYHETGVVLLRGILDLQTVNTLRQAIDSAVESLGESQSGYNFSALTKAYEQQDTDALEEESDRQHDVAAILEHVRNSGDRLLVEDEANQAKGSFLVDSGVGTRLRDFRQFSLRGAAPEIAGSLLNSKEVRFFGDQVFVKEPGTREQTAFHQDAPYFNIDGDDCCVLWIPVDPVRQEHGAMRYVRGSHKSSPIYQPNVFVSQTPLPGSEGPRLPDIEAEADSWDIVHFDAEPGDVLVHNYRTIHGTGGNVSRYQVRRAASLRYTGDDIRIKNRPGAPKQLHHKHELQEGVTLSGADFPVVWRRQVDREAA